jgi:hypothetical protein
MVKFILIFFSLFLFAKDFSSLILIEAKIFPKIAEINLNKHPKIAIVYDKNTKKIALKMHKLIKNSSLLQKINLNYDAYIFVKKISKEDLDTLLKNKKLIFTIYPEDIKNAMFSVYIGVRVYPYINPYLIKEADLKINPLLFKVGKIYER